MKNIGDNHWVSFDLNFAEFHQIWTLLDNQFLPIYSTLWLGGPNIILVAPSSNQSFLTHNAHSCNAKRYPLISGDAHIEDSRVEMMIKIPNMWYGAHLVPH